LRGLFVLKNSDASKSAQQEHLAQLEQIHENSKCTRLVAKRSKSATFIVSAFVTECRLKMPD